MIRVYGVYTVAMWAYSYVRGTMLQFSKHLASCVGFEWQDVTPHGLKFCSWRKIETVIPEKAVSRCARLAEGAHWLPNTNGRCYGVIAAAGNREDFERAAALAGAVAMVCFFEGKEGRLGVLSSAAVLAREVFIREFL